MAAPCPARAPRRGRRDAGGIRTIARRYMVGPDALGRLRGLGVGVVYESLVNKSRKSRLNDEF